MRNPPNPTWRIIQDCMWENELTSMTELSEETGIYYQSLMRRKKNPGQWTLAEICALVKALRMNDQSIASLVKSYIS